MWMALGVATALRLNRLWAFVGSRVPSSILLAWIAFSEVELAHRQVIAHPLDVGWQLFGDWLLGWTMVGAALATVAGSLALGAARRWQRIRQRRPDALRPPTSESPASAPPEPTG